MKKSYTESVGLSPGYSSGVSKPPKYLMLWGNSLVGVKGLCLFFFLFNQISLKQITKGAENFDQFLGGILL